MVNICEACGYFSPMTWEACDEAAVAAQCAALAGRATVALGRTLPLRTACVHPDGSGSWGGAEDPPRGTVREVCVTPERAAELLSAPGVADQLEPSLIEAVCWLTLAGPIAAHDNWYVRFEDYPEAFDRTLDALADLPDGHPLRRGYEEQQDRDLRWLQDEIITLLETAAVTALPTALYEGLREEHWLSPAAMRRLWDMCHRQT